MFTARLFNLSKTAFVVPRATFSRTSLIQPRLIHSTTEPTVPISPSFEKTTSPTTTASTESESEIDSKSEPTVETSATTESHPKYASTREVKEDPEAVKDQAEDEAIIISITEFKITHLSDEPSTSEEIIHAERLGLKPNDLLKEAAEKQERERKGGASQAGGRGFHTSARSLTQSQGGKEGEGKVPGDTEGVKVGEGNVGEKDGEGKEENDRSVSDESRMGEDTFGKIGGNQFGGVTSGKNQKRGFSTSAFKEVEGQGTGSKGTPGGKSKGEGLEHLKDSTPSSSEEAVHADRAHPQQDATNFLKEIPEEKKAKSPKE